MPGKKSKFKTNKILSRDKKKCNVLPSNKMQRDEYSPALKFDLKEKSLRTILELQNDNSSDSLRENVLAFNELQNYNVELNSETLLSPSFHRRKDCYTKTKYGKVLFVNTFRFFLITVSLSIFCYNLLAYHNEFTSSNY